MRARHGLAEARTPSTPRTLAAPDRLEGVPRLDVRVSLVLADGTAVETYLLAERGSRERPVVDSGDWRRRAGKRGRTSDEHRDA